MADSTEHDSLRWLDRRLDRVAKFLEQDSPRRARVIEDGAVTRVQLGSGHPLALIVVVFFLLPVIVSAASGLGLQPQERGPTLAGVSVTLAVIGGLVAWILSSREQIIISGDVLLSRGFGRFQRRTTIPLENIRHVAVRAFTVASLDLFVEIETESGTIRIAWGVSSETAHAVADAIQRRLPADRPLPELSRTH